MCCAEVLTLVFDMLSMEIDAKLSVISTYKNFFSTFDSFSRSVVASNLLELRIVHSGLSVLPNSWLLPGGQEVDIRLNCT